MIQLTTPQHTFDNNFPCSMTENLNHFLTCQKPLLQVGKIQNKGPNNGEEGNEMKRVQKGDSDQFRQKELRKSTEIHKNVIDLNTAAARQ